MDLVLCLALAGCSIGTEPVATTPHHSMPSEMHDHQDPGADTSKNRIISRSETSYPHADTTGATLAAYALEMAFGSRQR